MTPSEQQTGVQTAAHTDPQHSPAASRVWERVSVVIVTHHSAAVIGACLAGIGPAAEVVVVDNASDDETLDIVAQAAPHAIIERNTTGVGYGAGANQGLARARREFALLANPDSQTDTAAITALLEAADQYPDAALLSPRVLDADGADEPAHDVEMFDRRTYPSRAGEAPPDGPVCAAYLSGAVVLLRMSALPEIGPFDEAIFLYYEDDDFCMRLRAAGYSAVLVPGAIVRHAGGGSVRPSAHYRWEKFWHMAWSRLYLEDKCRGARARNRLARSLAGHYALKALGNMVRLDRSKTWRDLARLCGTIGYILGIPASRTTRRARPQATDQKPS
jgi:N-acetylglucosaminyl-diphospho-decaprenol L-rhamnosyltransferase